MSAMIRVFYPFGKLLTLQFSLDILQPNLNLRSLSTSLILRLIFLWGKEFNW
jgi:hypothetical protein